MKAWLRRGAAAASVAGERGDLWPAGALAWLVFAGWLPLLLVVAPPSGDDLEYLGVSLITSGSYPANVIALSVVAVAGFLMLCLLAATAEISVVATLRRAPRLARSRTSLAVLAVMLLATVPGLLAGSLLVVGLVAQAPAAFTSPDIETPILLRLLSGVLPQLLVLVAAMVVGQAFGGLALRHAIGDADYSTGDSTGDSTGAAIRTAAVRITRNPWVPLGIVLVGLVKDVLLFVASYALLRVLWGPIDASLGPGLLSSPTTLLLLVGFVATWLALLLIGGALHVAISAWWLGALNPVDLPALHPAHGGDRAGPLGGQRA